jgi:hypothetical protein
MTHSASLAAAAAFCVFSIAAPCGAATPNQLVNSILTPEYLDRAMCNDLGLISTQLYQGLSQGAGKGKRPILSREQVRDIAARFDEINVQLCAAVTPIYSDAGAWARKYARYAVPRPSDKRWDGFLADGLALKWADVAARFRTELLMLDSVINLELDLRPNVFNQDLKPLRDMHSPESRQLLQDIRRVSLTDEEAKVRFLLVTLHDQKSFREMIPARFDLDSLVRIEAKTRQLGLQLLDKYVVNLDSVVDARTRSMLFTVERREHTPQSALKLETAVRIAKAQMDALVSTYRYR